MFSVMKTVAFFEAFIIIATKAMCKITHSCLKNTQRYYYNKEAWDSMLTRLYYYVDLVGTKPCLSSLWIINSRSLLSSKN